MRHNNPQNSLYEVNVKKIRKQIKEIKEGSKLQQDQNKNLKQQLEGTRKCNNPLAYRLQ